MLRAFVMLTVLGTAPTVAVAPAVPEVVVTADVAALPASERAALLPLLQAASVIDGLFLRQVWAASGTTALALAADGSPAGQQRLRRFIEEKGPWLRDQHEQPFLPGAGPKPPVGSFYPAGSTRQELETWLAGLDAEAHAAATSPVTTVRRSPGGSFVVVPYSREFEAELALAASHLARAAAATEASTLRSFLTQRAAAFASNDYLASDRAWMQVDGALEPTIGPYEIYEDGWFNAKADFQAVIALRHTAATAALARIVARLQDLEDHLPLAADLRSADVMARKGARAPLRIADVVLATGDVHRALQTGAFVLPNDQRITAELGAKRTLLRNVHEARWRTLLLPVAQRLLPPADRRPSFEAYFTLLMVHELMHLLGPREIQVGGQRTSVRERLQELHAPLEEAKADLTALLSVRHLIDTGVMGRALLPSLQGAFLTALLHGLREGTGDAHGQACALILNTLLERGAVRLDERGFSAPPGLETAVRTLAAELLALQAAGDRARAALLLRTHGRVRPEVQRALDRLATLPRDVRLRFASAEKLITELHAR
jgi:hypothetical protein